MEPGRGDQTFGNTKHDWRGYVESIPKADNDDDDEPCLIWLVVVVVCHIIFQN